jgi:hypothetical protein
MFYCTCSPPFRNSLAISEISYRSIKACCRISDHTFIFCFSFAFITGSIDGITRFKSLRPPLLRNNIIYSNLLSITSVVLLLVAMQSKPLLLQLFISLVTLAFAVVLGLIGKSLLNVILPEKHPQKKYKLNEAKLIKLGILQHSISSLAFVSYHPSELIR